MNHDSHAGDSHTAGTRMAKSHYRRLAAMTALSFVAMYALMYAMVDSLGNVYMNVNQAYMAGLMAAPMVVIELALMRSMHRSDRLNALIAGGAAVVAVACFFFIRRQAAIGDREFLRSMIPHHASAILMCKQASITNTEIKRLCFRPEGIVESQQAEIEQMRALLRTVKD